LHVLVHLVDEGGVSSSHLFWIEDLGRLTLCFRFLDEPRGPGIGLEDGLKERDLGSQIGIEARWRIVKMPHDDIGEAAFHLPYRGLLVLGKDAANSEFFQVVEVRGLRVFEIPVAKGELRSLHIKIFVETRGAHGVSTRRFVPCTRHTTAGWLSTRKGTWLCEVAL
jgi:hypothetical protein